MNWDAISSIATAIAVALAVWQLRQSRFIAQTTFEDSIDQQYRNLAMKIPVDALLGKNIPEAERLAVREVVYNYLDLCNEQIYLRKKKRISKARWKDWNEGIKNQIKKPVFQDVWQEIKDAKPDEFTELAALEKENFRQDPAACQISCFFKSIWHGITYRNQKM